LSLAADAEAPLHGNVFAWARSRVSRAPRRAQPWPSCLVATWVAATTVLAAPPALAQTGPTTTGAATAGPAPAPPSAPAADPASPGVLEARAAFQEGIALARDEHWADALQAFERSDARHPHAITTYNIGYCERQLGHPTRARALFAKALADHQARGSVELPADLVAATQTYLSEADRQVARVVVTISPAAGAVAVDGRPLELTTAEGPYPVLLAGTRLAGPAEVPPAVTFEVDVDPGVHAFVMSLAGRPDVVASETLAPGARIAVPLVTPTEPAQAQGRSAPPQPDARSTGAPNHVPAFVALGIGAAGLVAGTISGAVAFGYKGPVNAACAGPDPAACSSKRDAGNLAADISTVSFVTGGVAVGVGAILFFTAGSKTAATSTQASVGKTGADSAPTSSGLAIVPRVGWGTIGLEGRF
jgi:hypothetical protein